MNRITTSIGLIALVICTASPAWSLSQEDVVGTWKLLSNVRQAEGSDKVVNNLGDHPNGVLIITAEHRFIFMETAEGRKAASTTEEFAALQKSEVAYSGLVTFSPEPNNSQGLKLIRTKINMHKNTKKMTTH